MRPHKSLDLATVRLLKWSKTSNIKRLKKMRRINRHIKSQNIVVLAISLKSIRMMALITVKNKKSIYTLRARFCVLIKIFYLIYIQLIICPTVIANSNLPIAGDCRVFVLKRKIIFCLNHNKQRDFTILRICSLNNRNPFSIARLS